MTNASAATSRLFGSIPKRQIPALDVPIVLCPACEKRRPMTIRRINPHLRGRDGSDVEYGCATCGVSERRTVKPA